MAVRLLSENSGSSPRISFSHDICLCDVVPVEQRPLRSKSKNSSVEFDFCVGDTLDQESSSADELFSGGKILPTGIKKKDVPGKPGDASNASSSSSLPLQSAHQNSNENSRRDDPKQSKITREETEERQSSKSFWRIGRSSSLNCGSGYGRSLCPLPPLLSRSNSTGSTPKEKQSCQKQGPSFKGSSSAAKPPLKKIGHGSGVRVNPILNVPSGNLFGLGSIFFNGRDKNRRK